MLFDLTRRISEKEIAVSLINSLAIFSICRTFFPGGKHLFLLLYFTTIVYFVVKFRIQFFSEFWNFVRSHSLVILLLLIYLLSLHFTINSTYTIFIDLIGGLALLPVFYIYTLLIHSREELSFTISNFSKILIISGIAISCRVYINIFDSFIGIPLSPYLITDTDISRILDYDNNFAILPVIFGTIILLISLVNNTKKSKIFLLNIILLVYIACIFLSGTRRGGSFLIFLILLIFTFQILTLFIKSPKIIRIANSTRSLLLSLIVSLIFFLLFFSYSSNSHKNQMLALSGTKNILDTKFKLTGIFLKYGYLINKDLTFLDVYNKIWTPEFNSDDPESSWGFRNHKRIYPLTGKNVGIVPRSAKGYMLDNETNASIEKDYCDAYSLITKLNSLGGENYKSWVYCYVSEDFDGDIVRLSLGIDHVHKYNIQGTTSATYDLNSKGEWKRLEISFSANTGIIPIYLSLVKKNSNTLSNLHGYVIFASPHVEKVVDTSMLKTALQINRTVSKKDDFTQVIKRNVFLSGMAFPDTVINQKGSLQVIRNKVFQIFNDIFTVKDTTALFYHKNNVIDSKSNYIGNERISRWIFALQVYNNEYNFKRKLIGGGFDHLHWFGDYFLKDKTKIDWPHNPFLSILLYSGLIGLMIYLYFLYLVFKNYMMYINKYPIIFIFFIITFYFASFSSGSPFDPPIFAFFSILPFTINSIEKKIL